MSPSSSLPRGSVGSRSAADALLAANGGLDALGDAKRRTTVTSLLNARDGARRSTVSSSAALAGGGAGAHAMNRFARTSTSTWSSVVLPPRTFDYVDESDDEDDPWDPENYWCGPLDSPPPAPPMPIPALDLTLLFIPDDEDGPNEQYRIPMPTAVARPEEALAELLAALEASPDVKAELTLPLALTSSTGAIGGGTPQRSRSSWNASGGLNSLEGSTNGRLSAPGSAMTKALSMSRSAMKLSRFTDDSDALDGGRGQEREARAAERNGRAQRLLLECQEQRDRKALLNEEGDQYAAWRDALERVAGAR